ncbi:hypothetical protein GQ43DRAFT_368009 [Delitschia confertaspora ATCC 74209]|uniref:Uncharacterized protein n=1 Tax=Delitschia confertaspora ATCC 74209 TaxID=1513339 RepID=A0A9P4JTG1_9PLEO|nr:hypothetical protein GQ43DRAFT_368009 [Delitschia confertaspora ATCC 74209]
MVIRILEPTQNKKFSKVVTAFPGCLCRKVNGHDSFLSVPQPLKQNKNNNPHATNLPTPTTSTYLTAPPFTVPPLIQRPKESAKTYNSQDSHVVTHRNTNWPVRSLSTADRTGSPILSYLWSYVLDLSSIGNFKL